MGAGRPAPLVPPHLLAKAWSTIKGVAVTEDAERFLPMLRLTLHTVALMRFTFRLPRFDSLRRTLFELEPCSNSIVVRNVRWGWVCGSRRCAIRGLDRAHLTKHCCSGKPCVSRVTMRE